MLEARLRLAAAARKARVRQRLIALGVVLAPVILALVYLFVLAKPQYAAEARFTVQSSQANSSSSQAGGASAAASILSAGAGMSGFVDGWAVQDFLNSRDCMRQLDRKIGLRQYLAVPSLDPLNHLSHDANEDQLFRAYTNVVHNSYNMIEQINVLEVDAYSPKGSIAISDGLIAVVQDFVNRMNRQGIEDALKINLKTVQTAQEQDKAALSALSNWRYQHGNVDPAADATMLMNQVSEVETSLSTAQVTLDQIKAIHNPNHPMLAPAERQMQALTARLAQLRGKMSGQGNTSADQLKTYVELTNAQQFADANLLLARQNYHQAYVNAMALQKFLSIIAAPVSEVRPSKPDPGFILLISLATGVAAWGVLSLGQAVYRSFKHG